MPLCDGSGYLDCGNRLYMAECGPECSRYWRPENTLGARGTALIGFDGEESWERVEVIRAAPESGEAPTQEVVIRPGRDVQGRKIWTVRDDRQTLCYPDSDFVRFHLGTLIFELMQLPKSKRFKVTILPWEE